jgi:hypothetical protein
MQSTGAFSASLAIDGQVLNFAGIFDADGNARFGTARALTMKVARTGKPSLIVAFKLDGGVPFVAGTISGTVTANDHRGYTMGVSDILAERSHFNGASEMVPLEYLGLNNGNGTFTAVFPALPPVSQPIGFQPGYYPQGDGFGTITVSKAGVVMLSGCALADGTTATASTTLSQNLTGAFFIPLYNKKGFVRVPFKLDSAQPDSDIAVQPGTSALWLRPAMDTHLYPTGWPEIIDVGFMAAKYSTMVNVSSLRAVGGVPVQMPDDDGNADLAFSDGQLEEVLTRTVNVAHNTDAVTKVPFDDPTFTLMITRTTGTFSGTFRHTDQTMPAFKGILYQKGPTAGGYGFFLTTPPTPIDYTGESGGVTLRGLP